MSDVCVLATGACNLASMLAALRRIATPRVIDTAREIADAAALVVPGVGAFGAVAGEMDRRGWRGALLDRIAAQRPTLAVCLGMQLLARESDESPGTFGLGVIDARVTRFDADLRVPQMGWNRVEADRDCRVLQSGYAYFANSYRLTNAPAGWAAATADYGGPFVAAIERGPVVACQFHPEISGEWGSALLTHWLAAAQAETREALRC